MCFHLSALNSKVDTKATSSTTAYRFSFSGKKSKWGCLHASLSECKTKSNISPGDTFARGFTLEARYALANWIKLPLNPTISAEYRFAFSDTSQDSGELALLIS